MRTKIIPYILSLLFIFTIQTFPQFNVLEKVKKKVNKTIEKNIDRTIDKTVDGAEKDIKEGPEKKGEEKKEGKSKQDPEDKGKSNNIKNEEELKVWRKFDFVPGDKIIFSDNLVGEEVGEFPSKWDLLSGNAETVTFGDQNAIGFVQNGTKIIPFMDKEDFLPEVFTIEFDFYYYAKYNEAYSLHFNNNVSEIDIRPHKVSLKNFVGEPGAGAKEIGWHHFALSFNKRALKVYYDQTRVLNIPRLKTKPTLFSISALSHGSKKGDPAIIKDIRVAEGGVKLYERVLSEGKFVTRGILFDVNKSIIKPESMGVLNKVVKMMNEHSDLNFSIEGHTDGDGDDASNQTLSEKRAASVKSALVDQGIYESRLTTIGLGESIPVDDNKTAVGKANNRRVEFVKI
jgi:OmpA-OmpF porin, OOP family